MMGRDLELSEIQKENRMIFSLFQGYLIFIYLSEYVTKSTI